MASPQLSQFLREHIRRDGLVVITHRRPLEAFPHPRHQAFGLFEPDDPLTADAMALVAQVTMNPRTPIRAATRLVRRPNQHPQLTVAAGMRRVWSSLPRVEATQRHVQHPTELDHRKVGLLRSNPRELYAFEELKAQVPTP